VDRAKSEIRAAGWGLGTIALYILLVLASGKVDLVNFAEVTGLYIASSLFLLMIVGTGAALVLLFQNRPGRQPEGSPPISPFTVLRRWMTARWERDRLISLIWPALLFALLMASFNAFKQMILIGAAFRYDELFARIDKALFLGTDPWRITHALFSQPWMTHLIDAAYHMWFLPMAIGLMICAYLPRATFKLRTQYIFSYIFVWIGIGSVMAYLLPSAGPCFYNDYVGFSDSYGALMHRLQEIDGQNTLAALKNQGHLRESFGQHDLLPGAGISAMPSVHNGLAALFALAAMQFSRPLGACLWAYTALIWLGSIHLGWHYAIDGIVAIAMTCAFWRVAGHLAERLERPLVSQGQMATA
jgi:PAP2 superfamily